MEGHNIFLGANAGNDCTVEDSYQFEFRTSKTILRKHMTEDEHEWLYAFLESCDNNLGENGTHKHFQGEL